MTRLTEQQINAARGDIALAATMRGAGVATRAAANDAWMRTADHHAAALLAHVDHLTADLATARVRLDCHGTPVNRFPRLPSEEPGKAARRAQRALLETGVTPHAWAVGGAICPEGYRCPNGPLNIFALTRRGRLPVHRGTGGHPCPGAGKEATPLRLATPTPQ